MRNLRKNRSPEVRYEDQVQPSEEYKHPTPPGVEAMVVRDSIYEQLAHHAFRGRMSRDYARRRKVFRIDNYKLRQVMMRTVNLPDYDWPAPDND